MKFLKRLVGAALTMWAPFLLASEPFDRSGGPFVPTPQAVVEAMLKVARVGPRDFVVDLGSGDGRIVLTAARLYKARGLGVEIDPDLVEEATEAARKQGLAQRVKFVQQDVREADLTGATVLTLYLLPGMMHTLQKKVLAEMRPGARIVSHDFVFEKWKPDRTVKVETTQKYEMSGQWVSDVHLWIVPAAVEGAWRGRLAGSDEELQLEIHQRFQHFDGRVTRNGRTAAVRNGRIRGERLSFSLPGTNGRVERYSATVGARGMRGEVRDGEAVTARWNAMRVP